MPPGRLGAEERALLVRRPFNSKRRQQLADLVREGHAARVPGRGYVRAR
jgi:hypothetical protein